MATFKSTAMAITYFHQRHVGSDGTGIGVEPGPPGLGLHLPLTLTESASPGPVEMPCWEDFCCSNSARSYFETGGRERRKKQHGQGTHAARSRPALGVPVRSHLTVGLLPLPQKPAPSGEVSGLTGSWL